MVVFRQSRVAIEKGRQMRDRYGSWAAVWRAGERGDDGIIRVPMPPPTPEQQARLDAAAREDAAERRAHRNLYLFLAFLPCLLIGMLIAIMTAS